MNRNCCVWTEYIATPAHTHHHLSNQNLKKKKKNGLKCQLEDHRFHSPQKWIYIFFIYTPVEFESNSRGGPFLVSYLKVQFFQLSYILTSFIHISFYFADQLFHSLHGTTNWCRLSESHILILCVFCLFVDKRWVVEAFCVGAWVWCNFIWRCPPLDNDRRRIL